MSPTICKMNNEYMMYICMHVQSCLTLCNPMDCSLPVLSVHENFQARILEWAAISSPGDLPNTGIRSVSPASSALAGGVWKKS